MTCTTKLCGDLIVTALDQRTTNLVHPRTPMVVSLHDSCKKKTAVCRLTSNNTRIAWTCWQSCLHRPLPCCARCKTSKHRLTHSQEGEDDTRTYRARYRSTRKNCRKKRSSSRHLRFQLTRDVHRTTYSLSTELTDIPISSHWN